MIPLARPPIEKSDIDAATAVLAGGKLVQGSEVAAFEHELGILLGVAHVVVVSSGTAALHIALAANHIGPGHLVVVPAYSWIATANVIEVVGARPIFVDVQESSYNMSPSALRKTVQSLSSQERGSLRALLPVHAFGLMAEMDDVLEVSDQLGAVVIEDAACALGAQLGDQAAGTVGHVGCFSFHPLKVITTGEGGAVASNDPGVAAFARAYRDHGQIRNGDIRRFVMPGLNLRMTDFQAALGRSQLRRLDSILTARRDRFELYLNLLADVEVVRPAYERSRTSAQAFVLRLPRDVDRRRLMASMLEDGIETGVGTIAMPFTDYYRTSGHPDQKSLPVTASLASTALTLPLYDKLEPRQQEQVVETLDKSLTSLRGSNHDN